MLVFTSNLFMQSIYRDFWGAWIWTRFGLDARYGLYKSLQDLAWDAQVPKNMALHSSVDSVNNCFVSPQFTLSTSLQDSMMLNHPSMMDLQDTWSLLLWVCLTYDLNSVSGWLQFWSAQIYIHIFLVSPLSSWFRFFCCLEFWASVTILVPPQQRIFPLACCLEFLASYQVPTMLVTH